MCSSSSYFRTGISVISGVLFPLSFYVYIPFLVFFFWYLFWEKNIYRKALSILVASAVSSYGIFTFLKHDNFFLGLFMWIFSFTVVSFLSLLPFLRANVFSPFLFAGTEVLREKLFNIPFFFAGETLSVIPVFKNVLYLSNVWIGTLLILLTAYLLNKNKKLLVVLILLSVPLLLAVEVIKETPQPVKAFIVSDGNPREIEKEAEVVVFPENFTLFFLKTGMVPLDNFWINILYKLYPAVRKKYVILEQNRTVYLVKDGKVLDYYDKVNLVPVGEKPFLGFYTGIIHKRIRKKENLLNGKFLTFLCFDVFFHSLWKKKGKTAFVLMDVHRFKGTVLEKEFYLNIRSKAVSYNLPVVIAPFNDSGKLIIP